MPDVIEFKWVLEQMGCNEFQNKTQFLWRVLKLWHRIKNKMGMDTVVYGWRWGVILATSARRYVGTWHWGVATSLEVVSQIVIQRPQRHYAQRATSEIAGIVATSAWIVVFVATSVCINVRKCRTAKVQSQMCVAAYSKQFIDFVVHSLPIDPNDAFSKAPIAGMVWAETLSDQSEKSGMQNDKEDAQRKVNHYGIDGGGNTSCQGRISWRQW